MLHRPLCVLVVLGVALALLPPGRGPATPSPESAGRTGFSTLLPLGRERFSAPQAIAPESRNPANAWLSINHHGLEIIRRSEGLRLRSYHLAGQWLIGYGHAATAEAGMTITAADADALLMRDVAEAEAAVRRLIRVPLNENEFSALVSLAYNMGAGAFARTEVVRRLNREDRPGAAAAFDNLVTATVAGRQVAFASLRRRRAAERALFLARPIRV
jgi:lysozyme